MNVTCLICKLEAIYGDLCKDCWLGLKMFKRDVRLLGRAISYLGPTKRQLRTKRERRVSRKRIKELERLSLAQQQDRTDREIRFDHAINKD